ncbi:hypothetical protein BTVI_09402 [Pitangus sulphuratus]|nr:hypothetical protein BTVI_09402 [Pitangus sulphuratus]
MIPGTRCYARLARSSTQDTNVEKQPEDQALSWCKITLLGKVPCPDCEEIIVNCKEQNNSSIATVLIRNDQICYKSLQMVKVIWPAHNLRASSNINWIHLTMKSYSHEEKKPYNFETGKGSDCVEISQLFIVKKGSCLKDVVTCRDELES